MQARPPPKFTSFAPPKTSSAPIAGPSRTNDIRNEKDTLHKRKRHTSNDSQRSDDPDRSSSQRKRTHKKKDKDKGRPNRHDELRVMDKIAARPTATQLEDRTRRPSQFTLDESGVAFYDDPFGSTGTLFLEIKYWPPGQSTFACPSFTIKLSPLTAIVSVRQVLGVPSMIKISRDIRRSTFEAHIPFHFRVSVLMLDAHSIYETHE